MLFGLGKGFCENYNYNYNRNNIVVPKEFNETPIIYPGIYNNLIATSPASFYSLKDGYQPYNYNYSSFLTNQFNGFVGNQLQNLVSDLNLLNVNQIYSQNSRTMKHNMKK